MELSNRKALEERAEYLMSKYSFDVDMALKIATQELEKALENEGEDEC